MKISTEKPETMAFNVSEKIKSNKSLISIGDVALKNVRTFKYLGHMITNNEKDPSHFLSFRISSAFQKLLVNLKSFLVIAGKKFPKS